jgi:hypothetical protein
VREVEGREVDPDDVQRLMASPEGAPPEHDVVEEALEELLTLVGLPAPDWPSDEDAPAG